MVALNGTESYDCDWTLDIRKYNFGEHIAYTDWENKNIYIRQYALHFGFDYFGFGCKSSVKTTNFSCFGFCFC